MLLSLRVRALWLATGLTGAMLACGGARPMVSAVEAPDAPRHPDGVTLDPPPAIPTADDRAAARGVVALREPPGDDEVLAVVHDFVQGFVHEDRDALRGLLAPHATQIDAHGYGSAETIIQLWEQRLHSFDYTRLSGSELFRPDQVEIDAYDELAGPGGRSRPAEMRPADVLVRVRILVPRVGSERLFADIVVLMLRREEGRFKIAGYGEDDSP